ncbi:MAG: hypothetical protein R6U96_08610 [Promethearchaeia archaeon]
MITGFSIIYEDEILYVSNESKYTSFEIILFIEKLISSINPKRTWHLSSIIFEGFHFGKESMAIKHVITEKDENLFFCIDGDFSPLSEKARKMVNEFRSKIKKLYKTPANLKKASQKQIFKEIIEPITDHLWDKYDEEIEEEVEPRTDTSGKSNILYTGVSAQGLPIISQLYDKSLLDNLDKKITDENVDLFSSDISAKLATIAMNTAIRAKTNIKEIHIQDREQEHGQKLILYGKINDYSLDFFASGDYYEVLEVFEKLKERLLQEGILQEEFQGQLKEYKPLKSVIDESIRILDN